MGIQLIYNSHKMQGENNSLEMPNDKSIAIAHRLKHK